MAQSAKDTAEGEIEVICYIDDDEPFMGQYEELKVKLFKTKRTTLSKYWNMAYEKAKGPIYMHCGDDLIFRTQGWDTIVKDAFDRYEDKIVFVHGDDGHTDRTRAQTFGTHGFIHKNWVDAVGYFVPPYFSSDYNDTHLNDVSEKIGRKVYVDILTEHMHPAFGKGELDKTHQERIERHQEDKVDELYSRLGHTREDDARKLMNFINGQKKV